MLLALLTMMAMDLHQPKIPLHFEPNQGQVAGETEWIAKAPGGTLYIKSTAIAFATGEPGKKPKIMRFVGSAERVKGEGLDPTGGYSNYFAGRDEKQWRDGVPHFSEVRYTGLYRGIDLVYYATQDGRIEYDLDVAAGADINQVEFSFSGFDRIELDARGDLLLHQARGVITQHRPRVWQGENEIACSYVMLPGHRVKLEIAAYDQALPITVDPVLDFSTYLGGPGNDGLNAVAVDSAGFIYVAGGSQTPASPSLNPFQQANVIVEAGFVAKLTPNADRIVFYSALRSSGWSGATGLGVDASGSPIVIGTTSSPDFPLKNAFLKTYTSEYYGGFVSKFSPDGTKLVYSSYFGGSGMDNLFHAAVDGAGNLIFSGNTTSRDLPVKSAFQPSYGGGQGDCFVTKVNPNGALVYSTYFGGSGTDYCYGGLAVDAAGRVYFVGSTYSDDLPLKNPIQTVRSPRGGFPTAFVARLTADGSTVDYATLLGGIGSGSLGTAAINSKGEIFLGGSAFGDQFTTVNAFQNTCPTDVCGLLIKLDPTGQQILASTFLTGSGRSGVDGIAVGSDDSLYVVGTTDSADFPSANTLLPFVGGGSFSQDAFAARFSGDIRTLAYSTFLGGNKDDYVGGLAVDSANRLYLVGWTTSDNFPVKNAFQAAYGGSGDGFVARISDSAVVVTSPLSVTPGQVQLRYVQGGAPIIAQNVLVSGASVPFTVSANAAWVTVNPQNGTAPVTLAIGAVPLAPGNYSATITVTPASGGVALTIPVSLKILTPAPVLTSVSPSFVPLYSDDTTITFKGSGFTSQTQMLLGGSIVWASPVVFVDTQTLQTTMSYLSFIVPGSYQFSAVNPQSDASGTVTVSVGGVTPVITSVVNAASLVSGPIAPGELIQVNGTDFGPPAMLSVTVGGLSSATVVSSTNTQALVVAPALLQGANASVVLTTSGLVSIPVTLALAAVAPGLFTADGSGVGQALISGTASPGATITLFGTGFGDLSLPVTVSINGEDALVTSVSAIPDQPGRVQIVATIPVDAPTGVPISVGVTVGGQSSQTGVTLILASSN